MGRSMSLRHLERGVDFTTDTGQKPETVIRCRKKHEILAL
jgi:hypothetical protein